MSFPWRRTNLPERKGTASAREAQGEDRGEWTYSKERRASASASAIGMGGCAGRCFTYGSGWAMTRKMTPRSMCARQKSV